MNTRRAKYREAIGTITFDPTQASPWLYDLPSDFVEVINEKNSLYFVEGVGSRVIIPITKERDLFLEAWDPSNDVGDPIVGRIFAEQLYLRPSPNTARTAYLEYYKRLAAPTVGGTVVIPDQVIEAVRSLVAQRLEHFRESPEKATLAGAAAKELLHLLERETVQGSLPTEIVESEDDDDGI